MFELSSHGPDVHVGIGPQYPWGGLYGGQIVAQAFRAATLSVDDGLEPHSIRAYFIRRGDASEPVRYEVDRIRNGRSFATRRVVARQAVGAILNAESSFQRPEASVELQTVADARRADARRARPGVVVTVVRARDGAARSGGRQSSRRGRSIGRLDEGDRPDRRPGTTRRRSCSIAAGSRSCPTTCRPTRSTARIRCPLASDPNADDGDDHMFAASLDHTVWFHRRSRRRRVAPARLLVPPLRRRTRPRARAHLLAGRRPRRNGRAGGADARHSRSCVTLPSARSACSTC